MSQNSYTSEIYAKSKPPSRRLWGSSLIELDRTGETLLLGYLTRCCGQVLCPCESPGRDMDLAYSTSRQGLHRSQNQGVILEVAKSFSRHPMILTYHFRPF